jgi:hypothetical protein
MANERLGKPTSERATLRELRDFALRYGVTEDLSADEAGAHAHFCEGGPRESGEFRFQALGRYEIDWRCRVPDNHFQTLPTS